MKRLIYIFLGMFFTLGLVAGYAEVLPKSDDGRIKEAIKQNFLADERVSGADINVDVNEGVVTLKGSVIGHEEAARAVELAKNVAGVVRVENKLEVDTTITNADVEKRLENNEENMEKLREQNEPNRDLGTVIDDATITAGVKMKFAKDDVVRAYKIDVDTRDGKVLLSGEVKSEVEAKRAIELAKSVEGVTEVNSVLVVKPE
jgi:hyperosmotically inducible protein